MIEQNLFISIVFQVIVNAYRFKILFFFFEIHFINDEHQIHSSKKKKR